MIEEGSGTAVVGGEAERSRFFADLSYFKAASFGREEDDDEVIEVLVFELDVFLVAGSSRVALESVEDLRDSSVSFAIGDSLDLEIVDLKGFFGAGASDSLLEELESEDDAGRAVFVGVFSSESLDEEDSLEEDSLDTDFLGTLFGTGT